MGTINIRKELHNYLEIANDKKVKAIYVMVEDEIKESNIEYSEKLKKELDDRYSSYKRGNTKLISATESKKRISKILAKASVK